MFSSALDEGDRALKRRARRDNRESGSNSDSTLGLQRPFLLWQPTSGADADSSGSSKLTAFQWDVNQRVGAGLTDREIRSTVPGYTDFLQNTWAPPAFIYFLPEPSHTTRQNCSPTTCFQWRRKIAACHEGAISTIRLHTTRQVRLLGLGKLRG